MLKYAPLFTVLCVASAGCYDSTNVLSQDAGPDAATVDPNTDARPATPDAPSADAPNLDAGTCEGVTWIDPVPTRYEMSRTVGLQLMSLTNTFELFFQNANPVACDGPCPVVVEAPSRGAASALRPAYWAPFDPDGLAVGIVNGMPVFAAYRGNEISWATGTPTTSANWLEATPHDYAAQVPSGHELAAIGMQGTRLYFATQRDQGLSNGYYDSFALHAVAIDGAYEGVRTEANPFGEFEHSQLHLISEASDLFVAGIQRWDFPPTVQFAGITSRFGADGSSCGTDAYALAAAGSEVGLAFGCRQGPTRGTVMLMARTPAVFERETVIATDRFVDDDSTLAIHPIDGGGWLAAYWNQDGLLAIVQVSADHAVIRRFIVPGPQFFWAETFPGPIALSQNQDGTFAVAWSTSGEGALQRFTLGCD